MPSVQVQKAVKSEEILPQFLQREVTRYERKGYGLVFAAVMFISFFLVVPHYGRVLWPKMLEYWEQNGWNYTTVFLAVNTTSHNINHLLHHSIYYVFYRNEFPFIERYKCNDLPWPWKEDLQAWNQKIRKSILLVFFNSNILPFFIYQTLSYYKVMKHHSRAIEDLPDGPTLALTLAFFMVCEDFAFYFSHRFLHWNVIYPYIHKVHHEYNVTIGIAAEYAHPLEFMFGNLLPTALGPMILGPRTHMFTVFVWYTVRVGLTLDGHSGYDFSWSPYRMIPFSTGGEYHDYHHAANVGNYASNSAFWDYVFGTNKEYYKYLKARQDKQDLKAE